MQAVFAIAAVTLFVPVLYHRQRNEEVPGLDANAPGKDCLANVPAAECQVLAPLFSCEAVLFAVHQFCPLLQLAVYIGQVCINSAWAAAMACLGAQASPSTA